jgi:hypothetical protein
LLKDVVSRPHTHFDVGGREPTAEEQTAIGAKLADNRALISGGEAPASPVKTKPLFPAAASAPETDCRRDWRIFNDDVKCYDPKHVWAADKALHSERYYYCQQKKNWGNGVVAPMCPERIK